MKKRLIICCDGTWNDLEMRYITNVGRLVQALLPNAGSGSGSGKDPVPQLIYYDEGVGADAEGIRRLIQGATGAGIDNIIYEAYRFICVNHEPGDELCLFGFSRGAFVVRSLAGMIGRVGLVPRQHLKHVPGALAAYRSKDSAAQTSFKERAHAREITVDLLGCWDTVGTLGIPNKIPGLPVDAFFTKRHAFHDTIVGPHVTRALHAVAIDEQRKEFNATLMHQAPDAPRSQKLIQHWFPGDHGCVGGGTWEKRGLSNHTLHWMVDSAEAAGLALGVDLTRLHDQALCDHGIFFDGIHNIIYGNRHRSLPEDSVQWRDIDTFTRRRWQEDAGYRPPELAQRFASKLDACRPGSIRRENTRSSPLGIGKSAWARVRAKDKSNNTGIALVAGGRYQIQVNRLQVWQDGDFDPCDICGWNSTDNRPWQDSQQLDSGVVLSMLDASGARWKLVQDADWFTLAAAVAGGPFQSLDITRPRAEDSPFVRIWKAPAAGDLRLAANDVAHRFDLVDKYDNNNGWIWVQVTRTS